MMINNTGNEIKRLSIIRRRASVDIFSLCKRYSIKFILVRNHGLLEKYISIRLCSHYSAPYCQRIDTQPEAQLLNNNDFLSQFCQQAVLVLRVWVLRALLLQSILIHCALSKVNDWLLFYVPSNGVPTGIMGKYTSLLETINNNK